MRTSSSDKRTGTIARGGLLLCLALIFSYLESRLPPMLLPLPGCKPGFANLVTAFSAYVLGLKPAFCISLLRVLLSALLFGSVSSLFYSLAGALLSFCVLALLLTLAGRFVTPLGVSAACAAAHNAGQLCAAAVLFRTTAVSAYLPWMLLAGTAAGSVTGLLLSVLLPHLSGLSIFSSERNRL